MSCKGLWSGVVVLAMAASLEATNDKPSAEKVIPPKASTEKTQVFKGEIADSQCSMNVHSLTRSHSEMLKSKSMGGTAYTCTTYCIQYLGGDFVLSHKDEVYRLDSQDKAKDYAGQKVKLTGTLDSKTRTIHVVKIEVDE